MNDDSKQLAAALVGTILAGYAVLYVCGLVASHFSGAV